MNQKLFKSNRLFSLFGLSLIAMLVLAACQPAATPAPAAATTAPMPTTAPAATKPAATATTAAAAMADEATINVVEDPKLGKILVDGKGMTLYMYTKDEPDKTNCNEACLKNWPPLLTKGSPKLGQGVDPKLVGSAAMADGTKIVTYNKMPLYYYVKDTKSGDTTGQDVGKVWYVVAPDGKVIGMQAPATATPAAVAMADEATINVATDPKLGKILVDGKGMTLYMYTKDEANKVNCAEACLKAWPPLLTKGTPKLGDGVDAKLVGTAALPDGSKIVTYNKMPLYYYVKDTKPGEVLGQDVNKVWYVVAPDGIVIGMEPPKAATTPAAAAATEPTINVATDAKLGKILVDGKGMTLYLFTKDEPGKSNCNDACLANWPALITQGKPILGAGVDPAKVGTAALADGRKIVTYNKMPLYYYVKDTKAGDTTGQAVNNVWYIVAP